MSGTRYVAIRSGDRQNLSHGSLYIVLGHRETSARLHHTKTDRIGALLDGVGLGALEILRITVVVGSSDNELTIMSRTTLSAAVDNGTVRGGRAEKLAQTLPRMEDRQVVAHLTNALRVTQPLGHTVQGGQKK